MQLKTFLVAAFAATAMAQGGSLVSAFASFTSDLATLSLDLPTTELSIFSVLATAIPSSLQSAITDPAVQSSLASDLSAGNAPSWYSALPADVKSYINSAGSVTSNLPLSSVDSSLTAGLSSIKASVSARLDAASSSAIGSSGSTSTGGAPAPTGAVVASMAGVVGVLALAIGL